MDSKEIRDLFETHGVPLGRKDVWDIKGKPVILHAGLERLAAKLGISWDPPVVARQTDTEVVILARGHRKDGIAEWSYGEVKIGTGDSVTPGANYLIKGKQPGYPWAMAEKRAKDRVIIKLAGLHGAYSEEEAEDFAQRNADGDSGNGSGGRSQQNADLSDEREPERDERTSRSTRSSRSRARDDAPADEGRSEQRDDGGEKPTPANDTSSDIPARLKAKIDDCKTTDEVASFMVAKNVVGHLNALSDEARTEVRDYAKKRLVDLGWPVTNQATG